MARHVVEIQIVCVCFILGFVTSVLSQPQPVPRLAERELDNASYVELARQWKAYIEKHGESAEALVNLGMAYEYSGEAKTALIAGKRAVEIDPNNPKALAFLGKLLSKYENDTEGAVELLERCRAIAPDEEHGLTMLAAIYQKQGRLEESEELFKTIFTQKTIPRPLQDYAYNMLVGLPQGAVLITNGDNDTFPPLALQAGMDFRRDVVVINHHLLNTKDYAEAIFRRHPAIKPKGGLKAEGHRPLSATILERMVGDENIRVYFAVSVNEKELGFEPELVMEGMNCRSSKQGLTPEESAELLLETYRLDSATDWSFAWDLFPSISDVVVNYVVAMIRLATQEGMSGGTKQKLLAKARSIAEFHESTYHLNLIDSIRSK